MAPDREKKLIRYGLTALAVLAVGLSIQYADKATERTGHRSAFLRWRPQIQEMHDGVNVYEKHLYPNPPIMALILTPVLEGPEALGMPPVVAALLWFYLKVGMAVLIVLWAFRIVEDPAKPFPLWAKALAIALSLRPIIGDLSHGNVNLFIFFLVAAGLYALHCGRELLSGLVLALAIACKVTPALFIPYLIWKRSWKGLIGCAAGLALFLWPGIVPSMFLGWEQTQELTASWVDKMVKPFVIDGVITSEHHNQSLPGLMQRLLTESPSFSTYDANDRYVPTEYHNVVAWSPSAVRWLVKGVMALFALAVVLTFPSTLREKAGIHSRPARAAEYSLILLGMLLFSERTWKHHCVTLVLPFAALCYFLARDWASKGARCFLLGTIILSMILFSTTSTSLLGRELGKLAQVYGGYTFAFLILTAALFGLLWRERGRHEPVIHSSDHSQDHRMAG